MTIDFTQAVTAEARTAAALAQAKAEARAALLAAIEATAAAITGPVPLTEKLSWGSKEIAARAGADGSATASQTAMIADEAAITGEPVADLAARVIGNADAYRRVIASLTGVRRHTENALDLAATETEVAMARDAGLAQLLV